MKPVLTDTGFLIALYLPSDPDHAASWSYLREHRHPLVTVTAVIVETCFFLAPAAKLRLLAWIRQGAIGIFETPVAAYAQLEFTLRKYADRDIDFADAALVWLANQIGAHVVLTVDRTDFEMFRLRGNRRFEVIDW